MFRTKYFDGVEFAQAAQRPVEEMPPFDPERMRSGGLVARLVSAALENPRGWLGFLRRRFPILVIGRFALVTRAADVREILERQDEFETPFGREMTEMAGGSNFVLGMQDGAAYRRMKSSILSGFPPGEVEAAVRPVARLHSQALARSAMPGYNAVELLKLVPARICRDYFGLVFDDDEAFADWSIALSALFFSDFTGSATTRELAVVAADRMRKVIDRSVAAVRSGAGRANTPLARLVAIHDAAPDTLSLDDIRSIMMGMVSGFAPTNLLAGGNALDVLLERADARAAVQAAVDAGDDAALDKAILEAMRFKPIFVGPSRYVARDAVVARGNPREKTLRKGTTVMPSILSAMFDEEAVKDPERFDPTRPAKDYLVYGHGIHWCIGSAIARVQIAESFKALFARPGLRRAAGASGRMVRRGAFPERLDVDFDVAEASKSVGNCFVTIVASIQPGASIAELREMVGKFGNPAAPEVREALDATGIVHFASLSVAGRADPEAERPDDPCQLVLEFSADGTEAEAIAAVADKAGHVFRPVFAEACGLPASRSLAAFMTSHSVRVSPGIFSTAGLCFTGTPGHSVQRILAEDALEREVAGILGDGSLDQRQTALERLEAVRRELAARPGYEWALQPAPHKLEGPSHSLWNALWPVLRNPTVLAGLALAVIALTLPFFFLAFGGGGLGWAGNIFAFGASLLLGIVALLFIVAVIVGGLYARLRAKEAADPERGELLERKRFERIADLENHMAHNHLAAISIMKPGLLRRLTLRIAFLAIKLHAIHVFRPGRLSDIGSIHYARWVLLPGTDKLMFFSNYGGSWGSYLEDFITKASAGLTGVWSNTLGYPKTENLFMKGAENGDLFKRWAREQQIPTLFWYSAYPSLTTARIRRNAAIRDGLARAGTDSAAMRWLDNFSSLERPRAQLETRDIQSIFFGGMGSLKAAEMVAVGIPEDASRAGRRAFLDHVLAHASFGDSVPETEAMIVGFGPEGLRRLGLEANDGSDPLSAFPLAFQRGMVSRNQSRVTGDVGASDPAEWEWGGEGKPADVMLVCYATDTDHLKPMVERLEDVVVSAGLSVVHRLVLTIATDNDKQAPEQKRLAQPAASADEKSRGKAEAKPAAIEHFGFRDNISQPIVEGTPRGRGRIDPQHKVAAGEFIFGYHDQSGHYASTIALPARQDPDRHLAGLRTGRLDIESEALRDFGRNGSFLVVRHMEQHVEAFEDYCREAAEKLGGGEIDGRPAEEWVGAKMLGRWKDGTSLVRNPVWRKGNKADNAFLFSSEDPQGHRCPLGSHVRRSNPRDSLGENPEMQLRLSKRHRILRIGRTWERKPEEGGDGAKGMLFMCLNADIERQFEFIQQTWVMSPTFHTLRKEEDPLVGNHNGDGVYTIPRPGGPLTLRGLPSFVTVRGGGYFFMPGKRSLRYLRSRL